MGALLKSLTLGPLGNTVAGAIGGAGLGSLLGPMLGAAAGSGLDLGPLLGNAAGGGLGGLVATAVVGLIKNATSK